MIPKAIEELVLPHISAEFTISSHSTQLQEGRYLVLITSMMTSYILAVVGSVVIKRPVFRVSGVHDHRKQCEVFISGAIAAAQILH